MENNNIFDSIDDALAERPSGQAWQRLENRLEQRVSERDNYRERLRTQWTRQMIFTAAAVACLLFAAVFTVFNILPKNDAIGKSAVAFAPTKVQTNSSGRVTIVPNESANDNRVLAKNEKMSTITEISPAVVSDATPVFNQKKERNMDIILPPQAVNSNQNNDLASRNQPQNQIKKEVEMADNVANVASVFVETKKADKPAVTAVKSENVISNSIKPAKAVVATKQPRNTNIEIDADENANTISKAAEIKAESKTSDKPVNATKNKAKKQPNAASINDLYWLIGNWHNETDTRTPFEAWSSEGKYELHGRGYLVGAKGDTSRLETFKIKQEGNSLALYLPVDITGSVYRYELEDYVAYEWTFENEEMSFPQQIVLHRLSKDNFVFTMQNTDPTKVQTSKMRFQDPRISPLDDHTSRTMKRAK